MIAILLYLIGLISPVVTFFVRGFEAPAIYTTLLTAYTTGLSSIIPALAGVASGLAWALTPFLGGLLLMGFARVMSLLGAINRALRGPA